MPKTIRTLGWTIAACTSLTAVGAAQAETLADALNWAYSSNPDLQGERANLRSVDENYVQARSGWQPQVNLNLTGEYDKGANAGLFGGGESNTGSAALQLSQPLYTGGLVAAKVRQAQQDISAERETLRGEEADVLFGVVSAYMDVLRDQQSLAINRNALDAYHNVVTEITARRNAGELTRTDVAQAQSQFENQQTIVNSAEAQLQASIAEYVQVVGQNPGQLETPPDLPGVPASSADAFALAEKASPSIGVAKFRAAAQETVVAQARSAYRPKVSVSASYGYTGALAPFEASNFHYGLTGQVSVSMPLFSGGLRSSQVRQAQALADVSENGVESAKRSATQTVANAWNAMIASNRNVESSGAAVSSATQALQGMQVEYRADQRSTYDLLNSESTLYSSQLNLVQARHDRYVAAARLLGVVGLLEAGKLVPALNTYDPAANFNKVKKDGFTPFGYVPAALDQILPPRETYKMAQPIAEPAASPNLRPAVDIPGPNAQLTQKLPTSSGR